MEMVDGYEQIILVVFSVCTHESTGLQICSKFELLSRYYIHFRTNTHGVCIEPFILAAMG